MNKKQAIIIATLLVLIVCVGVVAAKINDNSLYSSTDFTGKGATTVSDNNKTSDSKSDYFAATKSSRDQTDAKTLQELKSIVDDPSATQDSKQTAGSRYNLIVANQAYEGKIEVLLKSKGYENAICIIEDNKANVIVKCKDTLTEKQAKEIQNIVISVANIKDVTSQSRQ